MTKRAMQPSLRAASMSAMAALLAGCATVSMVPAGRLTPVKDRVTDEAIAHDLNVFDALDRRLETVAPDPKGADRYVAARAHEYVRIARDAYERNDRTSFVDDAVQWAVADIETLERGASSQAMSSVVPMPKGVVRSDNALWARADSLRRMGATLADPGSVAQAEAQLIRAGHTFLGGPACVDEAPLAAAQRLLGSAETSGRMVPAPARDTTPSSGVAKDTLARAADQPPPPPPPPPPTTRTQPSKNNEVPEKLAGVPTIVHFALDKSYLAQTTKIVLDELIAKVKPFGGLRIVLGGHTDIRASDEYNQALSERRVNAVKQYLISQGLSESRITAQGFGERQLLTPGHKIMDHARNRRVMITYILSDGTEVQPVEQLSDIQLENARRAAEAKKQQN